MSDYTLEVLVALLVLTFFKGLALAYMLVLTFRCLWYVLKGPESPEAG